MSACIQELSLINVDFVIKLVRLVATFKLTKEFILVCYKMNLFVGEKPYKCPVCDKTYSSSSNMQSHQRIHLGLRPYICDICGKLFTTSSNLMTHRRIHTGAKPFICDVCGKQFVTSSNLQMHKKRTHIGLKPFECDTCDKSFFTPGNLQMHKTRSHGGMKQFDCEECNKSFFTENNLQMHKNRSHLGIKSFKCDACGKEFSNTSNLLTHLRTHTGVKPHECTICGKKFSTTSNLKVHLHVHSKSESPIKNGITPLGPALDEKNLSSTLQIPLNPLNTGYPGPWINSATPSTSSATTAFNGLYQNQCLSYPYNNQQITIANSDNGNKTSKFMSAYSAIFNTNGVPNVQVPQVDSNLINFTDSMAGFVNSALISHQYFPGMFGSPPSQAAAAAAAIASSAQQGSTKIL